MWTIKKYKIQKYQSVLEDNTEENNDSQVEMMEMSSQVNDKIVKII